MSTEKQNKWIHTVKLLSQRVVILYLFSLLFKVFDLSYPNDVDVFRIRGTWFSAYFIVFGLISWQLSSWLGNQVNKTLSGKKATNRLIRLGTVHFCFGLLIVLTFCYSYSAVDILLFGKGMWEDGPVLFDFDLNMAILIFYLLILSYSAVISYYHQWREEQLYTERLLHENLQARYDTLRNQLDSHFLFNSLSVLTNLVYKDPDLSAEYITRLSKMFRYVLEAKEKNTVHVRTDLEFLQSYLFLMNIRYPNSIYWEIDLSPEILERNIPPSTLQLLVENAIKHNKFTPQQPLRILLFAEAESLVVENNLDERPQLETSLGLGLDNIRKRLALISGKTIVVERTIDTFRVSIPLMP